MTNLRETQKEISALRAAMGADDLEAQGRVLPMDTKPVRVEKPAREKSPYTRRGYRAPEGHQLYEATAGNGKIQVRSSKEPLYYATDVADIAGTTPAQKQGQIWSMFASEEAAEEAASKLRADGLTVRVVHVRPYAGQPGDADVPPRKERKK